MDGQPEAVADTGLSLVWEVWGYVEVTYGTVPPTPNWSTG